MSRNDSKRTKESLVRKSRKIYARDSEKIRLETKGSPEGFNALRFGFILAFIFKSVDLRGGIGTNLHIDVFNIKSEQSFYHLGLNL